MTVSELRIGNYFLRPNGGVGQITYHEIRLMVVAIEKPEYKPIPLTEDWLIKFGFSKEPHSQCEYYFRKDGVYIDNCFQLVDYEQCKLKTVHQLQNLFFALCGEELTVKQI